MFFKHLYTITRSLKSSLSLTLSHLRDFRASETWWNCDCYIQAWFEFPAFSHLVRGVKNVLMSCATPTELCFVKANEQRISTAPNRYFFEIFVYCRDNVVNFAGGEPMEDCGVIHIAEWFAMFSNSKEVVYIQCKQHRAHDGSLRYPNRKG